MALLTFGEGWHNNHHAHPTSARHGMTWREIDLTWMQLRLMKWLGLAVPTASQIANKSLAAENAA